jgi:hypothetical protein
MNESTSPTPISDSEIVRWLVDKTIPEKQIHMDVSGKIWIVWPFHKTLVSGAPNIQEAVRKAIETQNALLGTDYQINGACQAS